MARSTCTMARTHRTTAALLAGRPTVRAVHVSDGYALWPGGMPELTPRRGR